MIKRDKYLNQLIESLSNNMAKIVVGIRRVGKSYLLNQIFYQYLIESGVPDSQIIKFSFESTDDLRKIHSNFDKVFLKNGFVDSFCFWKYLSSLLTQDKKYYLILDEIQLLDHFEFTLNSIIAKPNCQVFVTGSNCKFLSTDIITEFGGRGQVIHLLPLVFSEFVTAVKEDKHSAFATYFKYGGLPELLNLENASDKESYLINLIQNVYLKDIISRYKLKSEVNIYELLKVISSSLSHSTNPRRLACDISTRKSVLISEVTIDQYVSFMLDSFILSKSIRYEIKRKHIISSPYKLYFEDHGLRNSLADFTQFENNHIMENIIYNELRYRGYQVEVGIVKARVRGEKGIYNEVTYEVDFIANRGSKRIYIQSCYAIDTLENINKKQILLGE